MPKATVQMWPSHHTLDLLDPDPALIEIDDIAHALSMIVRWTGSIRFPYTVGQHSLYCYKYVLGAELGFQALMHDATEAYLNDLCSPLKRQLPKYQMIEARLWHVIATKFGLPEALDPRVKEADAQALINERMVLKSYEHVVSAEIKYQHWSKTKRDFLARFHQLTNHQFHNTKKAG